jgi:hypothetical protein
VYEDEQHDCGKPGMGLVSQEEGTGEYVRKNGSEAYAYLPPELVLLEHHDGYSVENEGIDVQAGRREEACICLYMPSNARTQHVFL